MPTGRSLTEWSGHLHNTLVTPRLHQLSLETWQPPFQELSCSTSFRPSLQPRALDMPRKESVSSVSNLDTGQENIQRTGAKAGTAMSSKSKGYQVLEVHSASIRGTSSQANRRTFNWCPSCKRWTTTHTTATHTGSKKGADGTNGGECNQQCFTHFDPSVWTFENKVTPGVADDCPDQHKECLSVEDMTMKKMHIFCGDTRVYPPRVNPKPLHTT